VRLCFAALTGNGTKLSLSFSALLGCHRTAALVASSPSDDRRFAATCRPSARLDQRQLKTGSGPSLLPGKLAGRSDSGLPLPPSRCCKAAVQRSKLSLDRGAHRTRAVNHGDPPTAVDDEAGSSTSRSTRSLTGAALWACAPAERHVEARGLRCRPRLGTAPSGARQFVTS
jgi:hypothetical protein